MLKTNSKKARENIRKYILDNIDFTGYEGYKGFECCTDIDLTDFTVVAKALHVIFVAESRYKDDRLTEKERFIDWCQGLPNSLNTGYYYNRSAIDDLGEILEENEAKKEKYTNCQAERLLSSLIYRELSEVWLKEVK